MSLTKVSYAMITGAPVNVQDFGAVGDGVTDDRASVQSAYDFIANSGGGEIYWPKANYQINGSLYFGPNTKTNLGKSTITGNGLPLFVTGRLSANVLIANTGTTIACDKSSIEDGTIYNTGGIAFRLTYFRFYCYIKNIVCHNVSQIIVGDTCFYSHYENLIYFGPIDYLKATASTTTGSATIIVTNAVLATLSAGMEVACHFAPVDTLISSLGAPDSASAGFANVVLSNVSTRTGTAGNANTGFSASLNPKGLYEFETANSDMYFKQCSAGSRFKGFVLSAVASTTFDSCDIENCAYGFVVLSGSNNTFNSTHTETVSGFIWNYAGTTSGGSVYINGYNGFNIAGIITTGSNGYVSGVISLPTVTSAYTPYGFTPNGEPWLDLSSANAKAIVIGGGRNVTDLSSDSPSAFLMQRGLKLPNLLSTDSKTLDWYEQGVDTANIGISGSTTAGTATYSSQSCRWQRVGNFVNVNIELTWTGHTGTGNTLLTGLPYAPGTGFKQSLSVDRHSTIAFTAGNNLGMAMPGSSSVTFDLWQSVQGGASTRIVLPAAGSLNISGSYAVD